MTTTPAPPINGTALHRSTKAAGQALPVGDWRPIETIGAGTGTVWEKTPTVNQNSQPAVDPIAEAEAEAIRLKAAAEAEAQRIAAEAEAEAIRIKAAEDAERQRIANRKAAIALEQKEAEHAANMARLNRRREEEERLAREAREQEHAEQAAVDEEQAKRAKSATQWRNAALGFAIVCAIVALPVQMSAFWSRHAPWLLAAPLVLEGLAWVVLRGAAAAVDDHRPHWHYRLIAWGAAFVAASVNLAHGLSHFDLATAVGTAFASLAGPGVWDLHEHGRIRVRDGKPTRAERRAQQKAEKLAKAEEAAAEKLAQEEKEAAEKAAREAAEKLAVERASKYPKEWERALALAAALGETSVSENVWRRAWRDLHAADPGETVDVVRTRNMAETRMAKAKAEGTGQTLSKVTNTQRAPQMPAVKKPGPLVRGVRRAGDTPRYVNAARKQAAITARQSANSTRNDTAKGV